MRLLPREEKFYSYFMRQAALISEASELLLAAAAGGNSQLSDAAEKIRVLEQRGDEIIHEVFRTLNSTFITPLDPEDIHSLASHLDDVLDALEDSAQRMVDYRIEPMPPPAVEMCRQIVACGRSMQTAFEALNRNEKLIDHCIEINRIEEIVDGQLRAAVRELFDHEKDPIRIMKVKEIYEFLELTTDRCEDVADVLQNVVVKNS